jgi:hypothetical protein
MDRIAKNEPEALVMNRLTKALTTLGILMGPLLNQPSRILLLGSELGRAETEAVVATGATAGIGALVARAIRSASRLGTKVVGGVARGVSVGERAAWGGSRSALVGEMKIGSALGERAALTNGLSARSSLVGFEDVGTAAAKPANWEAVSGIVKETDAAKGLATRALRRSWETDPDFRMRVANEVFRKDDARLLTAGYRSPILTGDLGNLSTEFRLKTAIDTEPVVFYDASGKPISSGIGTSVEDAYRARARQVFDDVLKDIVPAKYKSEEELRSALRKAFESHHKGEYSFDVTTGKLELKLKIKSVEIKGEISAYSVAAKVATGAGFGTLSYGLLKKSNKPTSDASQPAPNAGKDGKTKEDEGERISENEQGSADKPQGDIPKIEEPSRKEEPTKTQPPSMKESNVKKEETRKKVAGEE